MDTNFRSATPGELVVAAGQIMTTVEDEFGELDGEQLAWQPAPGEWSVGQCLDHLVVTNRAYFGEFGAIASGAFRPGFWARLPLLPAFVGPRMVRMMEPGQAPWMKAPAIFQPAAAEARVGNVAEFEGMQRDLLGFMQQFQGRDADRIVLSSPAAGFVTYSLLDALRIIVTHEHLHLGQARAVVARAGFPARQVA